jgi:Tfp pilus assembly protein FimV
MTAISLQLEGAPWNSGGTGPGTFVAISGSAIVQGAPTVEDLQTQVTQLQQQIAQKDQQIAAMQANIVASQKMFGACFQGLADAEQRAAVPKK